MIKSDGPEIFNFQCHICVYRTMNSKQDAIKHIERMHETAVHCQICSKYFNSKWELEWHVWQIHPGKHRYQPYGAKFQRQSELIRHIKKKKEKNVFPKTKRPTERRPPDYPNQDDQIEEVNKNNLLFEICLKCITVYYL